MHSTNESSRAAPASPRAGRTFRPLHWLLVFLAAGAVVVAVEIGSVFFLDDDANRLRQVVMDGVAVETEPEFEASIGPGLLSLGRVAIRWIDDIPPEAHHALDALREVSVGVYRLKSAPLDTDRATMIRRTDERMRGRGWQRIVAVNEASDTVLVYVPAGLDSADELQLCVAVCTRDELIVVSARGATEPLQHIVAMHSDRIRREMGRL